MTQKNTKLFSEREAAEDYFGWSIDKMRQLRKSGQIEFYQFSTQSIKYSVEQLEAFREKFLKQTF